eukprot:6367456-Amphidinium_carterae.1
MCWEAWETCSVIDMPHKNTKWALYKAGAEEGGEPTPLDDRCEGCFKVWRLCFAFLDWDELVSQSADQEFGECVQAARKRLTTGQGPMAGAGVFNVQGIQLEISRSYQLASLSDIKRLCKVQRISAALLKALPTLEVPSEKGDGSTEKAYVFKHPRDGELRECKLKVVMESKTDEKLLSQDSVYFADQPKKTFEHLVQQESAQSGVKDLLNRDQHLHMFENWKNEKFLKGDAQARGQGGIGLDNPGADAEEKDENDNDEMDDEEDDETQLTGLAASVPLMRLQSSKTLSSSSYITPNKKHTVGAGRKSIADGKSVVSEGTNVDTSSPYGHSAFLCKHHLCVAHEDILDGCLVSWKTDSPHGVHIAALDVLHMLSHWLAQALWRISHNQTCARGGLLQELEKWKAKLSPTQVLTGDYDGRTISGLEKAVQKFEGSDKANKDVTGFCLLKNYFKLVLKLKWLCCNDLTTVDLQELHTHLEACEAENIVLPMDMMKSLLTRRTSQLQSECKYKELILVLNPFAQQGARFDTKKPLLSDIHTDANTKMATYEDKLFEKVLADKIKDGIEGKDK